MARKTPFHEVGIEFGAQMRELFGYWLPWEYANGHVEEHLATRQRVSVCDLDYMAECTIEGNDALAFVQQLFTNDFRDLSVGAIRYTAMCTADGGMVDDGTVWRLDDSRFLYVSGDEADYDWVAEQSQGFDVAIKNITLEWTTLALQGPRSKDALETLTDAALDDIRYYHFIEGRVANVDCLIDRLGYTGEFGYELHFNPEHGEKMWRSLMGAGAACGIAPCGQAALESLRQEAGYILVGNEHDRNTSPLEAGIGWTVKFDKESFNGKDALQQMLHRGLSRSLVWFKLSQDVVVSTGDPVLVGDQKIGHVTSSAYSPTFRRGIALAYVEPRFAIPGVEFSIGTAEGEHRATLSTMPLYDPGDVRSKDW